MQVPVDAGGAEGDEPLDRGRLVGRVTRVEVEVDARVRPQVSGQPMMLRSPQVAPPSTASSAPAM